MRGFAGGALILDSRIDRRRGDHMRATRSGAYLAVLFLLLAPWAGEGLISSARAVCPVGTAVGLCPANFVVPPVGCCQDTTQVRWCEPTGELCQLDCLAVAASPCCQPGLTPGCCNSQVSDCVCTLDPFCCEVAWDAACVARANEECDGCGGGCSPSPDWCGWHATLGRYGCRPASAAEPTGVYPLMCPPCQASCQGKQCGDDGCGDSCGACPQNAPCTASGLCQGFECWPDCTGLQCGDDGCDGSCGACNAGAECSDAGVCEAVCDPNCQGKSCGPDGCGGVCGECPTAHYCSSDGQCINCQFGCQGVACGFNDCGVFCGDCPANQFCVNHLCSDTCVPGCEGKDCGPDGCGGQCGVCDSGTVCDPVGACVSTCIADCLSEISGVACGSDGCGGSCGECALGQNCVNGACDGECAADCQGKSCGDDGCGGSCGACGVGQSCQAGACVGGCVPDCLGKTCGDDGCGALCGLCSDAQICFGGICHICEPACLGRLCGEDGCGGTCGLCPAGTSCLSGLCVDPSGCIPDCSGRACGDDRCGGSCGVCPFEGICDEQTHLCSAGTGEVAPQGPPGCPFGSSYDADLGVCMPHAGPPVEENTGCTATGQGKGVAPWWILLMGVMFSACRVRTRSRVEQTRSTGRARPPRPIG